MTKRLEPDPDLEALIRSLNDSARSEPEPGLPAGPPGTDAPPVGPAAGSPAPPRWSLSRSADGEEWLSLLLARAREAEASDLLLVAGTRPSIRVNGRLRTLGDATLDAGGCELLCAALLPDSRRRQLEQSGGADFSFDRAGLGRFRCNIHRQRGEWAAAVRLFPRSSPEIASLNLPEDLTRFSELEYGLVLVTGPTGCGKSTTLAALIRRILAARSVHLVTIEDPVEYEHAHHDSVVEHIELGRDVASFADALRAAMRQDPDVLLVGEMRDAASIGAAITAAETGHLVFSTLHTGDAPQTVHRIIDSYPPDQQASVRVQLSVSLAGIVSQQLLPRKDGNGRVPAVEILAATPAVRNLIRQGKIAHMRSQITLERHAGMLSLDDSLYRLVRRDLVDEEEARTRARVPEELALRLRAG